MPLPRPERIVRYNGTAPYPGTQTVRLSDSFEEAVFPGLPQDAASSVELVANVCDIDEGHNRELVRRGETPDGYSVFVARERECEAELSGGKRTLTKDELRTAMTKTIQWRIAHNIVKEG